MALTDYLPSWLGGPSEEDTQNKDLVAQAMKGMGASIPSQAIQGNGAVDSQQAQDEQAQLDAETAAYNKSLQPSALDNLWGGAKSAFGGALQKVATPQGLSTLAGLGAGVIGMNTTAGGAAQQNKAYDQAIAEIQNRQVANGDMYNAVNDSPEQLAQRQVALQGLTDRASMGLTPEDQAALQGIQRQSAQQFKAANATIGQDMSRRGMANSGLGLAQSMGAADQAQQQQAVNGQNTAAMSFQNKQAALNNLANQSGNALQADYSRQLGKAQNLSQINQFNSAQQNQANQAAANTRVAQGATQANVASTKGAGIVNLAGGAISALNPNATTMSPTAAPIKPKV
jgi:hypothetical protein